MALLICHTLRHSFNAKEHVKLQGRRRSVGLFVRPPQAVVSVETNEQQLRAQSTRNGTSTLKAEDLQEVVAAHLPTFYFHPAEQYFPCTVEWFLERCSLALVKRGLRRQVLANLLDQGEVSGEKLRSAQYEFDQFSALQRRQRFMLLQLDPAARAGEPRDLDQIPIYAHVKEVVDPRGRRECLEVAFMKFLAFNGSYRVFGWIPAGDLGAHDADWEHVTARLSPDGSQLLGVYYSAHRHRDGVWRSADQLPRAPDGRVQAFVALNGHGSYPETGTIPRVFFAFNDQTSDQGRVWRPQRCVIVTPPGPLPQVVSRGNCLNGSATEPAASMQLPSKPGAVPAQAAQQSVPQPQAHMEPAPWLAFEGMWGSSVVAPALQDWFYRAENPASRSWLEQVVLPLTPGVESNWQPVKEELEEAMATVRDVLDDNLDNLQDAADDVKDRYQEAVHVLLEGQKAGVRRDRDLVQKLQAAAQILSKPRDPDKPSRHQKRHVEEEPSDAEEGERRKEREQAGSGRK